MSNPARAIGAHPVIKALLLLIVTLLIAGSSARAEQNYVARYDLFVGYTFLDSPSVGLFDNGVHVQAGIRLQTWYSLGFDYSATSGSMTLTPNLLTTALQQQLSGLFQQLAAAGQLPAGFTLVVPTDSVTQTFAGGPQFSYRHFSRITLFVRPSVGAIHEVGTPRPNNSIATLVVAQLAPTGKKTDTALFYGLGGGADFILSKHLSVRVQADFVYDHLFADLMQNGEYTTRFSVGPCFNWGKNIRK